MTRRSSVLLKCCHTSELDALTVYFKKVALNID
jgi:hypothetical protein